MDCGTQDRIGRYWGIQQELNLLITLLTCHGVVQRESAVVLWVVLGTKLRLFSVVISPAYHRVPQLEQTSLSDCISSMWYYVMTRPILSRDPYVNFRTLIETVDNLALRFVICWTLYISRNYYMAHLGLSLMRCPSTCQPLVRGGELARIWFYLVESQAACLGIRLNQ